MKKKILSLLLAWVLAGAMVIPAGAAGMSEKESAAWDLYHLGLFLGVGRDEMDFPDFALDIPPDRAQGITMLVRLLGKEEEAKKMAYTAPFTDVVDWAKPYVAYAYENGLTNGRSETQFDPTSTISPSEYLTFVLRALGYQSPDDFAWDSAWTLSDKLGFTHGTYNARTENFDRGDVALISKNALAVKKKGTSRTLQQSLNLTTSKYDRCLWQAAPEIVDQNTITLSFRPASGNKETYTKFVVNKVTANGVPCTVSQYSTSREVSDYCKVLTKQLGTSFTRSRAFAMVKLDYDEAKAKAGATETMEEQGVEFPVIDFKFNCTGTLRDGTQVEELFYLSYIIPGYGVNN